MKRSNSGGGRIFIILGLVLALISGLGVFYVLVTASPQAEPVPTTKLVVSFQQIPARSEISADQIGQMDWPQTIPTPLGAYAEPTQVIGQLAKNPIYPGQPVIADMVISKSDTEARHSNASLILEKGQVAVALPVSVSIDVAEAIQTGDRVDILVTYNIEVKDKTDAQNSTAYIVSQKTLENVLILQVGPWPRDIGEQSAQSSGGGGAITVITVQLPEQDAVVLRNIQDTATTYSLALRAANDEQIFTTEPVTIEYLNKRFNFNIPGMGQ